MGAEQLSAHRRRLGRYGEDLAARWYQEHGYEVVARNWSCGAGELDIVARKDDEYVFCEVKARSSSAFGLPAEAVGRVKQARLRRLAAMWLAQAHRCSVDGGPGRHGQALDGRPAGPPAASPAGSPAPSPAGASAASPAGASAASPAGASAPSPAGGLRQGPFPVRAGRARVRFDVASVLAGRLEVIEGAF